MPKVIAFGCFDEITPDKLHHLNNAKEYGELTVVIARDETVKSIKGRAPLYNENDRLRKVSELGIAEKVILGDLVDRYRAIAVEQPDIVALSYDQKVFVDKLSQAIEPHVRIVRLPPYTEEGEIVDFKNKC